MGTSDPGHCRLVDLAAFTRRSGRRYGCSEHCTEFSSAIGSRAHRRASPWRRIPSVSTPSISLGGGRAICVERPAHREGCGATGPRSGEHRRQRGAPRRYPRRADRATACTRSADHVGMSTRPATTMTWHHRCARQERMSEDFRSATSSLRIASTTKAGSRLPRRPQPGAVARPALDGSMSSAAATPGRAVDHRRRRHRDHPVVRRAARAPTGVGARPRAGRAARRPYPVDVNGVESVELAAALPAQAPGFPVKPIPGLMLCHAALWDLHRNAATSHT